MLTARESSSVHTCPSHPKTPQNPAFALPKDTATAGSATTTSRPTYPCVGTLWSRAGSTFMDPSHHNSDLDNVFYISIKGEIAFSSLFFS